MSSIPSRPDSPVGSEADSVVSSSLVTGGGGSASAGPSRYGNLASAGLSSFNLSTLGLPNNVLASNSNADQTAGSTSSLLTGFNAISTVLNNPKKRQHPIDPSSSRYPALQPHKEAEIKRPPKQTVQSYIDEVGKEWDRYTRNRKGATEEAEQDGQQVNGSVAAKDEADGTSLAKLPPLSAVPQVFFDEQFQLGNPYTFDIVTERYGAAATSNGQAKDGETRPSDKDETQESQTSIPADHIEKLSHYSDLVEQHLLHEISTRSSSFFSALGALQDLSHSSASCLSLIHSLRSDLVSISDNQVKTGLKIVRKQDERAALKREMRGVERVRAWCENKRMAALMVGQGEYEEALVVIEGLRAQCEPSTSDAEPEATSDPKEDDLELDLAGIPAIAQLLPGLDELEMSISQSLEAEVASILKADLEDLDATRAASSLEDWPLKPRLSPLVHSLIRTQAIEKALTSAYRPMALASIRRALRVSLPSSTDEPDLAALSDLLDDDDAATGRGESKTGEEGAKAAKRLREMTVEQFQSVLARAASGLLSGIERVQRQEKGILELLDETARQEGFASMETNLSSDYLVPARVPYALPTTMASQLHSSIEVAHILLARLISLRASVHAQLGLTDFLGVFDGLMEFAERSEKNTLDRGQQSESTSASSSSMRRLVPLRSTLLNQSKEWLRYFHRVRLEQAARDVEEETWAQVDVGTESIEVVKRIVRAATEDPKEWQGPSDANSSSSSETVPLKTLPVPSSDPSEEAKSYYMVPATLRVLSLLQEYIRTIIQFSRTIGATEIMSRVIEFLKQFNSRTCQVVLGAGAMRSAGLKNITAKHLALASQSLSLFIHLIPYLRECVRRHLPDERQAVMLVEFDKLKRDYQEHQFEIHAKLVAIMGDRLSVHCRGLQNIDWNAPAEADGPEDSPPSKSIADLVKETTTLHKVLSRYLQAIVVEQITRQVLDAIVKRFSTEFSKVEVTLAGGESCRRKMTRDVTFLEQKLGPLLPEGVTWDIVGLKEIASSKEPPAPVLEAKPGTPSSAANPQQDGSSRPPTPSTAGAPAAYRSRMFPFGRRATAQMPASSSPASGQNEARASVDVPRDVEPAKVEETSKPVEEAKNSGESSQHPLPSVPVDVPTPVGPESAAAVASEASAQHETETTADGPAIGPEVAPEATTSEAVNASPQVVESSPAVEEALPQARPSSAVASSPTSTSPPATPPKTPATLPVPLPPVTTQVEQATPPISQVASPSPPSSPNPASSTAASTPASGVSTPTRAGRMTLQQRLAEAARKRAQAKQEEGKKQEEVVAALPSAQEPTPAPVPAPAVEAVVEEKSNEADPTAEVISRPAETSVTEASVPADLMESQQQASPAKEAVAASEEVTEPATASIVDQPEATEPTPATLKEVKGQEQTAQDTEPSAEPPVTSLPKQQESLQAPLPPSDDTSTPQVAVEAAATPSAKEEEEHVSSPAAPAVATPEASGQATPVEGDADEADEGGDDDEAAVGTNDTAASEGMSNGAAATGKSRKKKKKGKKKK